MNLSQITNWFSEVRLDRMDQLDDIYHPNVYFKDPFNEFESVLKLKTFFTLVVEDFGSPKMEFLDLISEGNQAFLTWNYHFIVDGKKMKIHGSSHLKFKDDLVIYHRDYWDTGEELFQYVPILGWVYKKIAKRISHMERL